MANIDVSELMDDPDFVDGVTVFRRSTAVGANGRQTITEIRTDNVNAIVQPASGNTVANLPEGSRIDGAMSVWTRFALRAIATGVQPDEIEWRGRRYVVATLNAFDNWGVGYTNATMTLKTVPG